MQSKKAGGYPPAFYILSRFCRTGQEISAADEAALCLFAFSYISRTKKCLFLPLFDSAEISAVPMCSALFAGTKTPPTMFLRFRKKEGNAPARSPQPFESSSPFSSSAPLLIILPINKLSFLWTKRKKM